MDVCTGDKRHALESARAILGEQMVSMGIRVAKGRPRKVGVA
jgi:hypothetical protein